MNIRSLYLYLFSFIGLLIAVIGTVQIVDLLLTVYVFDEADRYEYYRGSPLQKVEEGPDAEDFAEHEAELQAQNDREVVRQRQRQLSGAISMIVVGIPLYLYHWRIISREAAAKKKT